MNDGRVCAAVQGIVRSACPDLLLHLQGAGHGRADCSLPRRQLVCAFEHRAPVPPPFTRPPVHRLWCQMGAFIHSSLVKL